MKKEAVENKIKKFVEEHKVAIGVVAGIGLVAVGSAIGWKSYEWIKKPVCLKPGEMVIRDKGLLQVLTHVHERYPKSGDATLWRDVSEAGWEYSLSDLGEVGDWFIEDGFDPSAKISHVLMWGPTPKSLRKEVK